MSKTKRKNKRHHNDSSDLTDDTTSNNLSKSFSEQSISESTQFSPIATDVCAKSSVFQQRLTGSERKIKDATADIHNAIEQWEVLSTKAMNTVQEVANVKLAVVYERNEHDDQPGVDNKTPSSMPEQLEPLCESLLETYTKMVHQVDKMSRVVTRLEGVDELEAHTKGEGGEPLFQTWPTSMFATTARKLYVMYSRELDVRKTIVENIAHCTDRQTMMFYTSIWLHSPYVDSNKEELLHSMLLETGHLT